MKKKYIFIIGPARSGTTFLTTELVKTLEALYLDEPNSMWKYKNCNKDSDVLISSDITPEISSYIYSFINSFSRKSSSDSCYLIEKTPSNCFRIDFIKSLFPDSKYIFLTRDKESIANSAYKKWMLEFDNNTQRIYGKNKNKHKIRQLKLIIRNICRIPFCDYPFYIGKAFQELLFYFFGKQRTFWGPKYPGYKDDLKDLSIKELCLKQAEASLDYINKFIESDNDNNFILINYKDLLHDKSNTLNECIKYIKEN